MKKTLKWLLPIMVIALLVGALCIFASAADDGVYFTITDNSTGKVVSVKSNNIFVDEAGTAGSTADITWSDVTVDLKKDVIYDNDKYIKLSGTVAVNLNGHTLTAKKAGRFQGLTNAKVTFNGGDGGKFVCETKSSKLYAEGKMDYVFNNVECITPIEEGVLMDFRKGTITFNDCVLNVVSGALFLAGENSANAKAYFNGCTVNVSTKGSTVFSYGRSWGSYTTVPYAEFRLSGTTINAPDASYIVSNVNMKQDCNNDSVENNFKIIVDGSSAINAPNAVLIKSTVSDYIKKTHLQLAEGALMNIKSINPEILESKIVIPEGCVKANANAADGFKVVKATDVCNVTFMNGTETVGTKVMAKGVTPAHTFQNSVNGDKLVDGVLQRMAFNGWNDAEGNAVTALETDMTVYYSETAQTAYWAAYSAQTPALDKLVYADYDSNNLATKLNNKHLYVYLYQDCKLEHSGGTVVNWNLNINLNQHRFGIISTSTGQYPTDATFQPNGGHLTITNGDIYLGNAKIAYPGGGTGKVTLDGCKVEITVIGAMDCRGGDITIKNTELNLKLSKDAGNAIMTINNAGNTQTAAYTFENVKVTNSGSGKPTYLTGCGKNAETNLITLNVKNLEVASGCFKDGLFSFATAYTNTVNLAGKIKVPTDITFIKHTAATAKATINIDNVTLSSKNIWSKLNVAATTIPAHVLAYNGTSDYPYTVALVSEAKYETENIVYPTGTVTQYTMAGAKPQLTSWFDLGNKQVVALQDSWVSEKLAVATAGNTVTVTPEYKTPAFAIFNSSGSVVYANTDGTNLINTVQYKKIPTSGTLYFYENVRFYDASGSASLFLPVDKITIELNGYEFNMRNLDNNNAKIKDVRFEGDNKTLTIKNGKLLAHWDIMYSGTNGTVINLIDVDVTSYYSGVGFDFRGGTVNMTGGSFVGANVSNVVSCGNRGGIININISGTTIKAKGLFGLNPRTDGNYTPTANVKVDGATLELTSHVAQITNRVDSSTANLTITDSFVKTPGFIDVKANPASVTATLDNTFISVPFTSTNANVAVNYAQGQTLLATDKEGYPYKVGAVTLALSSNLTLYSDFNLNVFLGNNVTKVMVGETELELEEYDAKTVKTAVKAIAPNNAANDIVFTVTYVDGGVTYTVDIAYSVVKYAQALLAGSYSAESKALVASAVKYIDTAYAVADAEKPATLTALTASAGYTAAIATASNVAKDAIDGAGNYTALAVAINSAQLRLTDDYKYVLNLNATYTGTLTVNGVAYRVVNGTVGGKTYVTVTLRGYEFNDGLTVTATTADGAVEGTYTLADYVEAMANGTDADLDALLVALYNFTVEAKEYNEFVKANGLK